jgi:hypothetical protein
MDTRETAPRAEYQVCFGNISSRIFGKNVFCSLMQFCALIAVLVFYWPILNGMSQCQTRIIDE